MRPRYSMHPKAVLKRLLPLGPLQAVKMVARRPLRGSRELLSTYWQALVREGRLQRDWLTDSIVWKSIFRQEYPDTDENRSRVMTNTFYLHWHPVRVKAHTLKPTYTLGLGLISLFLYVLLVGTGGILMFFYIPSAERAYSDIQSMHTTVDFGALMRNMHRWGAHLMVLAVLAHMCRVFYTGGYKHPREFNWVIGVIILAITLLLSFTGYLLVWDQLSFWAITVGTNIAGATPFIGSWVKLLLLGSPEVGQPALLRFYVFHLVVLPIALTALLGFHFWRIRKDGGLSAPLKKEDR